MNDEKYKKERIKYIQDKMSPYTIAGCDEELAEAIFNLDEEENYKMQHEYNKRYSDLMYRYRSLENNSNYLKIKFNNLQSKIDKANEYLEEHFIFDDENGEYYQTHTFDKDNAKELHEILKEDK